jgi:hypothetical protein
MMVMSVDGIIVYQSALEERHHQGSSIAAPGDLLGKANPADLARAPANPGPVVSVGIAARKADL